MTTGARACEGPMTISRQRATLRTVEGAVRRIVVVLLVVFGCASNPTPPGASVQLAPDAAVPVQVRMDFTRTGSFFAAPFPSEDLRTSTGGVDLSGYPNPAGNTLVSECLALIQADADGFSETSGVFFSLTGTPDVSRLPDLHTSVTPAAAVFLMDVDPSSPDHGRRLPVSVHFQPSGGPYGAANLLTVLPLQGIPLRPTTLYAAVVTRSLHDAGGNPLAVDPSMAAILGGNPPPGLNPAAWSTYHSTVSALSLAGVSLTDISGLAVFRTHDPTVALNTVLRDALSHPLPIVDAPFVPDEVFPTYCVFHTTLPMPEYQGGTPPYPTAGGGWVFDSAGHPVVQRQETSRIVVTLPRTPMPPHGFPTVVFIRTGAGGDRPLVDRGVQAIPGGPPIEPGSGPAQPFAHVGFAGVSIDGPLGGLRNPTNANEDFTIFNVANPAALRDNVRQSAMELALLAHALDGITVNASSCPGLVSPGPVRFDTTRLAIFGHSMGATIEPLVLSVEARYGAGILSGSGGSWIANIVDKLSPVAVAPVMNILLGYNGSGRVVDDYDPALSVLQWAGEPADPPVYNRTIVHEPGTGHPRNVFMVQGIVDTYILPSIANASSLSLGLDLAGMEYDNTSPRLSAFTPVGTLLGLSGGATVSLPAGGNVTVGTSTVTALLVQALQDPVEDGHEVIFQTEGPKHQYACYLQHFAMGTTPVIPLPGALTAPCP